MTQMELNFVPAKISALSATLEALQNGGWWRLEAISAWIDAKYGRWYSDATISARIRELRALGHEHETRPRGKGSNAVEYRLVI